MQAALSLAKRGNSLFPVAARYDLAHIADAADCNQVRKNGAVLLTSPQFTYSKLGR